MSQGGYHERLHVANYGPGNWVISCSLRLSIQPLPLGTSPNARMNLKLNAITRPLSPLAGSRDATPSGTPHPLVIWFRYPGVVMFTSLFLPSRGRGDAGDGRRRERNGESVASSPAGAFCCGFVHGFFTVTRTPLKGRSRDFGVMVTATFGARSLGFHVFAAAQWR